MSYFVVEDFRLGLDRRKHILCMPSGSLYTATNANITRGGDMESCKAFVAKYTLPLGTFGLIAAGNQLYTFGSIATPVGLPADVHYQRLQYPDGSAMTSLVAAAVIKGQIYAIATFVNGYGNFYNGMLVSDWVSGSVSGGMVDYGGVAAHFAALINTNANYTAAAMGAAVTITGKPGVTFSVATETENGHSGVDNQYAVASLIQAATAATTETPATATVIFVAADNTQMLTSMTINGAEILPYPVSGADDNSFASGLANTINANTASSGYTASAAANVTTIRASPGLGATPNGYIVAAISGFAPGVIATTNVAGGVTGSAGAPQISTVNFGGTFEVGDGFLITLEGVKFGTAGNGVAGQHDTFVLTYKGKTYAIAGPNLLGSAIGDATQWASGTGSFITDMSSEAAGAEELVALSLFQGKLAIFARSTTQIWLMDADPANNEQDQVLTNIGTLAPKTVVPFGDADTFFLSDTGLRSLKVRSVTNSATLSDIGSPVDPLIIAAIKAAGADASKAVAVIEPIDGRFLLQIGTITYVFNYFPNAKIAGWTTYESGLAITDFAIANQRVYARAGNVIYLLGGDDNNTYANQAMNVKLPFLSSRQIATLKHFTGVDFVCDGRFEVYLATDPNSIDEEEAAHSLTKSTIGIGGTVPVNGEAEVLSLRLQSIGGGEYARLCSAVIHYEPLEAA